MPLRENSYNNDGYSSWTGFIFVFNLIVGTGALTLPSVFAKAGWFLGLLVIIILAGISYMTVTFIIETIACANAVINWKRLQYQYQRQVHEQRQHEQRQQQQLNEHNNCSTLTNSDNNYDADADDDDYDDGKDFQYNNATSSNNYVTDDDNDTNNNIDSNDNLIDIGDNHIKIISSRINRYNSTTDECVEQTPLFSSQSSRYYILDNKIELGEMADIFFNDIGRIIFYLCIAIYLYGDLSIYSAAVAKTIRNIICTQNQTFNGTDAELQLELCWENHTLTRFDCYRLTLIGFMTALAPFTFFNVQKTKYIQMCTVILRWIAFTTMITMAIRSLIINGRQNNPPMANFTGLPALFGACVYSFMCHHSLPSLLTPIREKHKLHQLLSYDYLLICVFYLCLALTGTFAFEHLEDLYTLNFVPASMDNNSSDSTIIILISYFLILFPVFTLSTSFPIIAITLRNNLQTLFLDTTKLQSYNILLRRILFPLLAILPPFFITYFTDSLTSLVSFTGSYAGNGIQYLMPIGLVYVARRTCTILLGQGIVNDYRSPFKHNGWLVFVLGWSVTCMILVTINFFVNVK